MPPRGYLGWVAVVFGTGWLAVGAISAAGEPGRTTRLETASSISGGADPAESRVDPGLPLRDLSNAALVEEYEKAGLALRGTPEVPTDEPFSAPLAPSRDPRYRHFLDVRREIFRRGSKIVPLLLDFLRREAPTERAPEPGGPRPGFTADTIELLVAMSNPRASRAPPRTLDKGWFDPQRVEATMDDPGRLKTAWVLLEVFEGFGGKAKGWKVAVARGALGRLTHCAFLKEEVPPIGFSPMDHGYHMVVHPDAVDYRLPSSAARAAALYRDWLRKEGSDAAHWLPLARQRARKLLESDRIYSIHGAAEFLRPWGGGYFTTPRPGYDDQPQKTLARLAAVIGQFERRRFQQPGTGYYWRGQQVPPGLGNWTMFLTSHGPRARPHVGLILGLPECRSCDNWGCIEQLVGVGGKDAMEHFAACLKTSSNVDTLHYSRLGIDRWAGRCFADDAQRLAWWRAHRHETEEQWLRDSLPTLAAQCDDGVNFAGSYLRAIVPECPLERAFPKSAGQKGNTSRDTASCVEWLRQHQARLMYDAKGAVFRLAKQ